MKFYDRKLEIETLKKWVQSPYFELIYLLWKRRIGKTELVIHLMDIILKQNFLYLFIERLDLPVFLHQLEESMYAKTWILYQFKSVEDFLEVFFLQSPLEILIIDEFQNFNTIDKSIFSTFQKVVDRYHNKSQKKIIVLWSIQSMMIKIFENANEPLYKRANYHMMLKEFDLDTQVEILQDMFGDQYSHRILLDVYSFFGGVPYYLKLLWEQQYTTYSLNQLLTDLFFSEFSPLQNEGKEILIEEFGQKYKRFFAILEAIARGNHQRNEIMQKVWLWTGEIDLYLKELIEIYDIIEVKYPIFQGKSNISRYVIKDKFLSFRFRYVYSNKEWFELWSYGNVLQETLKDFSSYQGFKFEQLVRDFLILENKKGNLDFVFTKIGMWLDRKNHEIDLVYSDEKEHIVFLECKMNEKRINSAEKHQLSENVEAFFEKNPKFREIEMKVWFAVFDEKTLVRFEWL